MATWLQHSPDARKNSGTVGADDAVKQVAVADEVEIFSNHFKGLVLS